MNATGAGALLALVALAGCQAHVRTSRTAPPLGDEGEVLLYLEPLAAGPARVDLAVTSVAVVAQDGAARPLEVLRGEATSAPPTHQRLLARGRLPPGDYAAVLLGTARATLQREGAPATDLLVPGQPAQVAASFAIVPGQATVLWARVDTTAWLAGRTGLAPAWAVAPPPTVVPDLAGFCTNTATSELSVFDRVRQRVLGTVVLGRGPQGVALDAAATRAYVAVPGEGEVQVVDVASARVIGRVRLDPGDAPWEVGLTPDGRVLVVVNSGSSTASFVDAASWVELSRVTVGDTPRGLVTERAGHRAYVLSAGSATITVLDLAYRSVVGTLALQAEPIHAALDRDGALLYVTQRGSQYLSVFSVPDLAPRGRIFVGLGATDVQVDPRSGRIYVGSTAEPRLDVLDPAASMPVGSIDLPGAASRLLVIPAERLLFAIMPAERSVAVVDLTTGRLVSVFDVGAEPHQLAISGAPR